MKLLLFQCFFAVEKDEYGNMEKVKEKTNADEIIMTFTDIDLAGDLSSHESGVGHLLWNLKF